MAFAVNLPWNAFYILLSFEKAAFMTFEAVTSSNIDTRKQRSDSISASHHVVNFDTLKFS